MKDQNPEMSSLGKEIEEGIELMWRQIVQEDSSASDVAAVDHENRYGGLYLLAFFAIVCFFVYLPFFILICTLRKKKTNVNQSANVVHSNKRKSKAGHGQDIV